MDTTCGIYLFDKSKRMLIVHPTGSPDNVWSIPKGLQDEGETLYEAAVREMKEETTIDMTKLTIKHLSFLVRQKYPNKDKTLSSYMIVVEEDMSDYPVVCHSMVPIKNYPENDKFRWVDLEEAEKLIHVTQVNNIEVIKKLLAYL